ncbi:MAG: 3-phosphoshikimate 1-carboxyvinyltransferase [Armatimonadetes bacterium]|nr:3-phosphoshikimate 1-carboxyvinyltransferase [Armatimonadota bacterium]
MEGVGPQGAHPVIEIRPATGPIQALVRLPGSKSYTNRALVTAALARGQSQIRGALFSDDTEYMASALADLGFRVNVDVPAEEIIVEGEGGRVPRQQVDLFCGNAGTAVRFLTALVAVGSGTYRVDGDARMRTRPQQPLLDALGHLGVEAKSVAANGCPPLEIRAQGCRGGKVTIEGGVSSQFFSALAMAAPAMREGLDVSVLGDLASKPYLDMTAEVMRAFGVELVNHDYRRFVVAPGQVYTARVYDVEPDASAASYFLAAAAVTGGRVTVYGLSRGSLQGDIRFVDLLEQMGCRVEETPRGLCVTGPELLQGIKVDMNDISDVAMTLAAVAPFAATPTEIRNIAFIRRKESDRIAAVTTELSRLGIKVTEFPDGWRIEPGTPRAGEVATYDDHRMAMSFSVIGLRTPGLRIRDPECVSKTFPGFFTRFAALTSDGLA